MGWKRGGRIKLVKESEAPVRTRAIFDEVRHSLGLPVVPTLYQVYAAFPDFLDLHWQAFRPVVQSRGFLLLGARLAAESYTRAHNYFEVRAVPARETTAEGISCLPIAQVLDYYQYLNPLQLLLAVAQMQAFEGPVGRADSATDPASHPYFPVAPCLLSETHATEPARRVWEERRRTLDLAFISDEHRALAMWPDFYQEYWMVLHELMRSPLYADCQQRIGESAWSLVRELPVSVETSVPRLLEAGLSDEQLSSITRINESSVQALSGLLLDVTFARIGYEGGTRHPIPETQSPPPGEMKSKQTGIPIRAA